MKLNQLTLLFCFLPACVVESPIGERTRTAEQEIAEESGDWCERTCGGLVLDCAKQGCDCPPPPAGTPDGAAAGENCACLPEEPEYAGCVESCRDMMAGFNGHGEACAEAGIASMQCLDEARTCEEFDEQGEKCFKEPADVPACSGGKVTCEDESGGTGGSSGVAPPSGAAGSATNPPLPASTSCEYWLDSCSDGAIYHVTCNGSAAIVCDCYRNGSWHATFELPDDDCYLPSDAINPGCGWNLAAFD